MLEDTVVECFDSLSKESVIVLLKQLGWYERMMPIRNFGNKAVKDLEMIEMSEDDRKRVDTIVKMFNYFGPSARNTGLPD